MILCEMSRVGKSIETKSWLVIAKGWGGDWGEGGSDG